MMSKGNLYIYFVIVVLLYGCRGNTICINLAEKKVMSREGNIVRFSIEDNENVYRFRLKDNIRNPTVVDLNAITLNNNLLENYPGAGIRPFFLKPNKTYVFRNYTNGDAGVGIVKFYTDSSGNLHSIDNEVCE